MTEDLPAAATPEREIPQSVMDTIITGYYTRGVAAADRARDSANRGYTIASAVAAALVAAGVFTHLDQKSLSVQVTGLIALGTWLLAALLFIYAVSLPVRDKSKEKGWTTDVAFAEGVADQVDNEVKELRRRLIFAVATTVVATALTVTALALATTLPAPNGMERERIVLTAKGDADLAKLCARPVGDAWAAVKPSTLKDAIVSMVLPAKECNAQATTVYLPKTDIVATKRIKYYPRF